MIDSGIWRNVPFPLSVILLPMIKGLFKSPVEGAQTTIHCSVSEDLDGVSGKYFIDCKVDNPQHLVSERSDIKVAF